MPRLGWQMKADRNGEKQSAYEIEVRNAINKKTVYKTGKIGSTDSQFIKLNTDKICAGNTYEWRVRVYDADNQPSAWSKFQMFCFAPHSPNKPHGLLQCATAMPAFPKAEYIRARF